MSGLSPCRAVRLGLLGLLLLVDAGEAGARRRSLHQDGPLFAAQGSLSEGTRRAYPKTPARLAGCFRPPAGGPIRLALVDADSTLRLSKSGKVTPSHRGDVVILPLVAGRLAELAREGYLVAVVSNQGGVAEGFMTERNAVKALRATCKAVTRLGGKVHYFDYAPGYDELRKPATGMADRLARVVQKTLRRPIDWQNSIMIGDAGWKRGVDKQPDGRPGEDFSNSDRLFAENLRNAHRVPTGMKFHHPRDFFGWEARLGVRGFSSIKDLTALLAACSALEGNGRR